MRRSARISWRTGGAAAALLLPFLTLTACSRGDQAMADKLAAAEAAAARAEAAQHAAEKAAAAATAARPAPVAEATEADMSFDASKFDSDDGGMEGQDNNVSMGEAPAVAADVPALANNGG
jgi:hypothetical protein